MIIPFFIPHSGCPHQCVFCNQKSITGVTQSVDSGSLPRTINAFLASQKKNEDVYVAFYGGSFTALPHGVQRSYLSAVAPFIDAGRVKDIRLSTRPDAVDRAILDLLQEYRVTTVELGVQSMNNQVLARSGRGHTAEDAISAVSLLRQRGFRSGVQLMCGLPGDNEEIFSATISATIALKPDFVRIYPALVIKNTPLAEEYRAGRYAPLTLDEAVARCKAALAAFRSADIEVIRMGLQATEELEQTGTIIAGPYHPAFRQLVQSSLFMDLMQEILGMNAGASQVAFHVNPADLSCVVGHKRCNMLDMQKKFPGVKIEVQANKAVPRGKIKSAGEALRR